MTGKKPAAPGELAQRVASAVVLACLVLGAVWLGNGVFLLMVVLATVLMACEWSRVTSAASWPADAAVQSLAVLAAIAALIFADASIFPVFSASAIVMIVGCVVAAMTGVVQRRFHWWRIVGIPYLGLGIAAFVWLRLQERGLELALWLLVVIWAMDIGAYFAGRGIGGPKLAPRASPNKTWSGLIGGILAAAVSGAGAGVITGLGPVAAMAGLGALIGGWSQAGDIAESAVKRHFGVKDMSNLIPGHGGILDRVDGLLFAAPVMVMAVLWLLPAWR